MTVSSPTATAAAIRQPFLRSAPALSVQVKHDAHPAALCAKPSRCAAKESMQVRKCSRRADRAAVRTVEGDPGAEERLRVGCDVGGVLVPARIAGIRQLTNVMEGRAVAEQWGSGTSLGRRGLVD